MEDQIDAVEVLHNTGDADLHIRFIGMAKGRQFLVNVQFAAADEKTAEQLRPEEQDFLTVKILGLVIERITGTPNPGLH
ncbi:MAG: hypothetical protein KGO02_00605 [Alphaproteobacteria bacterium]|nr:hypothetical protein [Alphaproteobacteria bacterium]